MKNKEKTFNFCIYHGYTEFYKNGHCKECVKYNRIRVAKINKENNDRSIICLKTYLKEKK